MFVTPLGEVTDEATFFDTPNQQLPVAIAEFRRGVDTSERDVEVRAHLTIENADSHETHPINDALWFKSERHRKNFQIGDTNKLVIGFINDRTFYPYEGRFRPFEATYETDEKYFEWKGTPLKGQCFIVKVELIGTNFQRKAIYDRTVLYKVNTNPPNFTILEG